MLLCMSLKAHPFYLYLNFVIYSINKTFLQKVLPLDICKYDIPILITL